MAADRLLLLLVLTFVTQPALSCRCLPQSLAESFATADVVAEVEVIALSAGDVEDLRTVEVQTLRDFKNARGLQAVQTKADPVECGMTLQEGKHYWIFGRLSPGSTMPAISVCDGSRSTAEGYIDVPAAHIRSRLKQLSAAAACTLPSPLEINARLRLETVARDELEGDINVISPNGAYRFLVRQVLPPARPPHVARLFIDNERETLLVLSLQGIYSPMRVEWVNEKLLFLQADWNKALRSELLLDVEAGQLLAVETTRLDARGQSDGWLDSRCGPR